MNDVERTIEGWDGLAVVCRRDEPAKAWIFVAIHDTTMGPAVGGTRLRAYPKPSDALEDAMRLAEAMTDKWAVLDMPFGGGKSVIAPDEPLHPGDREALFLRYGELLESLRGAFLSGVDVGVSPGDMAVVARATRNVHGVDFADGSTLDPGPFTARGVRHAIGAALDVAFGNPDPAGRSILVQGVGDVGRPLAVLLARAGAQVLVTDVDVERAEAVAREIGGRSVVAEAALDTPCDVFAPCAIGGILDDESVERVPCKVVAGSANAQLASPRIAERLHRRGIVYAPDFVANGGGAAALGLIALGEDEAAAIRKVDGIGETVREIFREAAARDESPLAGAQRIVARRLAEKRRKLHIERGR
ncbi:MAG TPA: Glu/Leu/Phe/Val dehydrogenase dimerization domain-containing protein [Gemmatimonadota bacterium]|nr:Glu/Leu/Phe/Val dehydrogenase dimerization domain-containing protein [Gemmatimonadota bacterium]